MALMSNDGALGDDELREIEGSTVDIKSAYRLVPLSAEARPLHFFRFLDPHKPIPQYVLDGGQPREEDMVWFGKTVLPFGWTESVSAWCRVSEAVKALHLWQECPVQATRVPLAADGSRQDAASIYIDDAGLYALLGLGHLAQDRYLELLVALRIPASETKLKEEGGVSQLLKMLGVEFDFAQRELRLTPERLATLKRRLADMRGRNHCPREEFESVVGVLSFCASCVQGGRTFMRALYREQARGRRRGRRGRTVRITRGVKVALSWWLKFMDEYNGVSLILDSYETDVSEAGIYPDASLEGFGATFVRPDGTAEYLYGRWDQILPGIDTSQETGEWHVSEFEALALLVCMHQWGAHFGGKRIIGRSDNESTVTAVNSMRCSDAGMHTCVQELWYTKMVHSFDLRLRHIRTEHNVLGDCPSRWTRADGSRDPRYEAEYFAFAESVFGLTPDVMTEVVPTLDVRGMLQRMRKSHRGRRHRLNGGGAEA